MYVGMGDGGNANDVRLRLLCLRVYLNCCPAQPLLIVNGFLNIKLISFKASNLYILFSSLPSKIMNT